MIYKTRIHHNDGETINDNNMNANNDNKKHQELNRKLLEIHHYQQLIANTTTNTTTANSTTTTTTTTTTNRKKIQSKKNIDQLIAFRWYMTIIFGTALILNQLFIYTSSSPSCKSFWLWMTRQQHNQFFVEAFGTPLYSHNHKIMNPLSSSTPFSSFLRVSTTESNNVITETELSDDDNEHSKSSTTSSTSVDDTESSSSILLSYQAPIIEISKRRNVAIISHPDSGKTTMTEKLLLYGGALIQAGAVRSKSQQRNTASDFMEIEQQRGISISSTVLNFDYTSVDNNDEYSIRLIDTPGHNDFSEDTYRSLSAADNALMLLDGAKGLEPQTRKLFEVCRLRSIPLFTFVNKLDRPSLSPYEIIDQIEKEFNLLSYPIVWPIGDGERFKGILDRTTNIVHLFEKSIKRGGKAISQQLSIETDIKLIKELINDNELYNKLLEDIEMLNELIQPFDINLVMDGKQTPLFFGSAMTNFGIEIFLNQFCNMGTKPMGRYNNNNNHINKLIQPQQKDNEHDADDHNINDENYISPEYNEFTGFVFKTQANLDPKHRDRLAYIRIISGTYQKGMKVSHSRSKSNKKYQISSAQTLFGNDRTTVDIAYPGDVIGINNPNSLFAIGDTLYTGSTPIQFPGIPSFSPEQFAYIRSPNPSDYKSFRKGIDQLLDEGAIQSLRQRSDDYQNGPLLLAAVGQLQFDVVQARLKNEYNVESILEPLIGYSIARWVDAATHESTTTTNNNSYNNQLNWDAVNKADNAGKLFGIMIVQDKWKRPVLLFRSDWKAIAVEKEEEYLYLKPWAYPPIES